MAKVSYSTFTWQAASYDVEDHLVPGAVHSWISWAYDNGDVIAISAHPGQPALNPNFKPFGPEQILIVENIRMEWSPTVRRVFYDVKNVGEVAVFGYTVGMSVTNK